MLSSAKLLAAADACERAARAGTVSDQMRADYDVLCHLETIQRGLMFAELARYSPTARPVECLPLRAEGDDFGRVQSRIPSALWFTYLHDPQYGWDFLVSNEGQQQICKEHPVCAVKTVSGKATVGWRAAGAVRTSGRRPGVHFGRGTLNLAS